jgi:hypothetical protein
MVERVDLLGDKVVRSEVTFDDNPRVILINWQVGVLVLHFLIFFLDILLQLNLLIRQKLDVVAEHCAWVVLPQTGQLANHSAASQTDGTDVNSSLSVAAEHMNWL